MGRLLVRVGLSARDAAKASKRGDVIIVVDVLRCSSTIISLLDKGVEAIFIAESLRGARELRKKLGDAILAGERGGLKPKGFDFGNSPLEFPRERVKGGKVVLTTTSGTKAISSSRGSKWVFVGAFLNAGFVSKAALKKAEEEGAGISIIASGRKGEFSLEDFLCCGLIASELSSRGEVRLDDAAKAALLAWREARANLSEVIKSGDHAKRLMELGFKNDVEFCVSVNSMGIVPYYRDGAVRKLRAY